METPGINIVGMTMLLQFVVSFGFILVVNAPQNMVAYATGTFEARDFVRTGLVLTVIAFALVMLLGATGGGGWATPERTGRRTRRVGGRFAQRETARITAAPSRSSAASPSGGRTRW